MDKLLKEKIESEGNEMAFKALGLDCFIRRHLTTGHWCGYVKIPEKSRLLKSKIYYYSDSELGISDFEKAVNNIDVHGGITFSGDLKEDGSTWWGFDCGHSWDMAPFMSFQLRGSVYRDKEYVIDECKKLAKQVGEISKTY